ncbi:unnamed protein product, partial [Hydatigera taeniaeformis]|uniref:Vps16_C domain-containing protein n=1 Tax=Hydatigena taeniaeformis TaxID=6205 RepID=A0A0R3WS14_HYDTA
MVVKMDVSTLDPFRICMDRIRNAQKESKRVRKERWETARGEASRFKLFAVYNESKKVLHLLEQTPKKSDNESHLLRCEFYFATSECQEELMAYAKQQVIEMRQSKTSTDHFKNRRLLQPLPSVHTHPNLITDEFEEMTCKLTDNLNSQGTVYSLIKSVFKDPPDEAVVNQLATILGSQLHLHQYLVTFKQPKHLLPYLIHIFGGSDRTFHLINKALMGDLWSIYRIAKYVGFDLKATVRLLTSVEKTVAAATSCLVTKPCHFHHVEDLVNELLRREWTSADLIELANGRYVQSLKPGEKPNRNPLLTVATSMSENAFLEFYRALHQLNHRYFKSL